MSNANQVLDTRPPVPPFTLESAQLKIQRCQRLVGGDGRGIPSRL